MPDLAAGGTWTRVRLRWRRDPLTGASARILTGVKLQPASRPDLTELTAKPAFCPFDTEHLETATFPFPAELTAEGRIRLGKAVVVPNIMAYATHSAVGIYDPGRHFLDLDDLTPSLVGDALAAMVRHAQAVRRLDPAARWSSINGNHLPPAGASLVHPHLQSAHDAYGLTGQRLLAERSGAWMGGRGSYWAALVDQEAGGPRWVGQIGRVAWLTPFAPSGFHEVWAVVSGAADVTELTEEDSQALGRGLSRVLAAYRAWNLTSFNFGVIGGGPQAHEHGHQVVLKVLSRSNPEPVYRSDATYFERIYEEALIDLSPEEVARRRPGQILIQAVAGFATPSVGAACTRAQSRSALDQLAGVGGLPIRAEDQAADPTLHITRRGLLPVTSPRVTRDVAARTSAVMDGLEVGWLAVRAAPEWSLWAPARSCVSPSRTTWSRR